MNSRNIAQSLVRTCRRFIPLTHTVSARTSSSPSSNSFPSTLNLYDSTSLSISNSHYSKSLLKPTTPVSLSSSLFTRRFFSSSSSKEVEKNATLQYEEEDVEVIEEWEEEGEVEARAGDGGDGGGVVLQGVTWGERALSIATEAMLQFGDGMKLYAFKTSPRGYIYVRLDKLENEYGCPSMDELEEFSREYKKRLDVAGAAGDVPDDLALEVSSPGAERILKVPDDLSRFKDMPMRVCYIENPDCGSVETNSVFMLDSLETESGCCVWKLANVKENRDPQSKGRPLSRKQKDLRIKLDFSAHKRITLYLD